jgi:predicted amino acid dehydrogenase
MRDVVRVEPKAANKREPFVKKILEWMPVHEASHITGLVSKTGAVAEGWFMAVPLLPSMFTELPKDIV